MNPNEFDPGVLAPFPDLPLAVHADDPPKSPNKRRHHDPVNQTQSRSKAKGSRSPPTPATAKGSQFQPAATKKTSAPISLPASHVDRTPSELHLEQLTLLAEDENVRMRYRILSGMQNQMRYRNRASGEEDGRPLFMTAGLAKEQDVDVGWQERTPGDDGAAGARSDASYLRLEVAAKHPIPGEESDDPSPKQVNDATDVRRQQEAKSADIQPDATPGEEECVFRLEM